MVSDVTPWIKREREREIKRKREREREGGEEGGYLG
jgi:hypothetical protein